jgi:hypothetical protein
LRAKTTFRTIGEKTNRILELLEENGEEEAGPDA